MKYSSRYNQMPSDEFARRIIYKQESRNSFFVKKLTNIDNKINHTKMVIESNHKKIYQLLTIILLIQSVQFVQYNSLYISVFRNVYYNQLSEMTKTICNNAYDIFNYGYTVYASAGNYLFSFT